MITSSSIQYISQVLAEPQNISDTDAESIAALIETYPYFVPARYMDAANKHKKEPYNNPMMSVMQLYMSNWLMYCQFLQTAMNGADIAVPTAPQQAAEAAEAVAETPVAEEEVITVEEPTITAAEEPTVVEPVVVEEPVTVFEAIEIPEQEEVNIIEAEEAFVTPEPVVATPEPLYTQKKPAASEDDYQPETDESFILPVYTEDYFLHQGMQVSNKIPEDLPGKEVSPADEAKSLMVVMSFSEWLLYFKKRKEQEQEEVEGQKAVKTMWQKEKLAAALEEENEEIPEKVFEMAVNSITKEDDLVSESLAEIYSKQGKFDKAIEMYRKLSLRNPQKKAYFARKIEVLLKEKQS
ncbi:MAG TPA: tetratricopeptide repeat protein [Flavipsychrobacter sp.]|nr:tetratricopeptide repeat protein [Flavipsychrobacter sp.]